MPQATPAVSIVLPVLNGERYLPATLDSLSAQTFGDFEIVAVDNGSTDRTPEILAAHARRDPRLRVDRWEDRGIAVAANRAHALARAPLISRMDADDIAWPRMLERQVATMAARPELVLLGVWAMLIDPDGRDIRPDRQVETHEDIVRNFARGRDPIATPGAMMRRAAVERVGGYRRAFTTAEDYDLWVRLSEVGRVANLPEIQVSYRVHLAGTSRGITTAHYDRARVVRICALARVRGLPEPLRDDKIDLAAALAIAGTTLEAYRAEQVRAQSRRAIEAESPVMAQRLLTAAREGSRDLRSPLAIARARFTIARARLTRAGRVRRGA